jgi:hypothetical protein
MIFGFAVCVTVLILAACGSSPAAQRRSARELAIEMAKPVRTSAAQRPTWIDEVPVSAAALSFIGVSRHFAAEPDVRSDAREDGRRQLVTKNFYHEPHEQIEPRQN